MDTFEMSRSSDRLIGRSGIFESVHVGPRLNEESNTKRLCEIPAKAGYGAARERCYWAANHAMDFCSGNIRDTTVSHAALSTQFALAQLEEH